MDYTDLKDYLTIVCQVTCDGELISESIIDSDSMPSIPPHENGTVILDAKIPGAGKCYLKLNYLHKCDAELLPEGALLGFDELPLGNSDWGNRTAAAMLAETVTSPIDSASRLIVREEDRYLFVSNSLFSYTYNKLTGIWEDMIFANTRLLEQPMQFNLWRAPTDNDRNLKHLWFRANYDKTIARAYDTTYTIETGNGENQVIIRTSLSISALFTQRILTIEAQWIVSGGGKLDVTLNVNKDPEFPMLPRFGLRLFLPGEMSRVTYYGQGPMENYPDKYRASWHGLFHSPVSALHEDYLRPQENGSHNDCDYVILTGRRNTLAAAGPKPFSFNASVYTQEELAEKAHNYELQESPYTVLCLDYRQNGIGSNSCGPKLLDKYRFDETTFTFAITLVPSLNMDT